MLRFYLPAGFFFFFRPLKGRKPAFGQYEVFSCAVFASSAL
jgi:hypothetical protein